MGQSKYNQTAILAKEGKLPPKKPPRKISQEELYQALLQASPEYQRTLAMYKKMLPLEHGYMDTVPKFRY